MFQPLKIFLNFCHWAKWKSKETALKYINKAMVFDWLLQFRHVSSSSWQSGTSPYSPEQCRENVQRNGNELLVVLNQADGSFSRRLITSIHSRSLLHGFDVDGRQG